VFQNLTFVGLGRQKQCEVLESISSSKSIP